MATRRLAEHATIGVMRAIAAVACAIAFAAACDGGPTAPTTPTVAVPGATVEVPEPAVNPPGPTVEVPGPPVEYPGPPKVEVPGPTVEVRVSGRVLDFGTNAGVPKASVVFGECDRSPCWPLRNPSTTVTDANGSYRMTVPSIGSFVAVVDGRYVGGTRVNGPDYPGDLFVNWGRCIGRYGTVTDARTLRPIAGASVAVGSYRVVTDVDGWYRADRACVGDISGGTGSGAIRASHPEYVETVVNGFSRTIDEVLRLDIELKPR